MTAGTRNTKIYHEALESPVTCQKERRGGREGRRKGKGRGGEKNWGGQYLKLLPGIRFHGPSSKITVQI